jgi:hypothetical protein
LAWLNAVRLDGHVAGREGCTWLTGRDGGVAENKDKVGVMTGGTVGVAGVGVEEGVEGVGSGGGKDKTNLTASWKVLGSLRAKQYCA